MKPHSATLDHARAIMDLAESQRRLLSDAEVERIVEIVARAQQHYHAESEGVSVQLWRMFRDLPGEDESEGT